MRRQVVSRTLTTYAVTVLVIDKETRQTEERVISIPKCANIEKEIKKLLSTEENIVFVSILSTETVKEKYSMPVETFMELATPATDDDVEVEDEDEETV